MAVSKTGPAVRGAAHKSDPVTFEATCSICNTVRTFTAADDFWDCRDNLVATDCPHSGCITRERALAAILFSLRSREAVKTFAIHEAAPASRGLMRWLLENAPGYQPSGYFPDKPFGEIHNYVRNEDLEAQTFEDETFDVVIHMDVLEHLFDPFEALREIYRTLKPGGLCLFSAPIDRDRRESVQVAFREPDGSVRIVGEPEYHGDPQKPEEGVLVTWRYGYDLPLLIGRQTGFDVELRRFHARNIGPAMGYLCEVFVLTKPDAAD